MRDLVDEHKSTFDPNHLRDFIDVYLNEIQTGSDPDFKGKRSFINDVMQKDEINQNFLQKEFLIVQFSIEE